MDVREKLVEIVCDAMESDGCIGHCNHSPCFEVERVVNALIANCVTVQEWIPVKDKLPEIVSTHKRYRSTIKKSIRVLCVCVQKNGKTMVKEGYCEWYNDYPEPRWKIPGNIDDVTHWMPLPQPPKEE